MHAQKQREYVRSTSEDDRINYSRAHQTVTPYVHDTRLFFFNDTATPGIYTLSLHDALPILPKSKEVPLPINVGKTVRTATVDKGVKKVTKEKDGVKIHFFEEDDGKG